MDAGTGSRSRCKGDERVMSVSDSPLNAMFRIRNVAVPPPEIRNLHAVPRTCIVQSNRIHGEKDNFIL